MNFIAYIRSMLHEAKNNITHINWLHCQADMLIDTIFTNQNIFNFWNNGSLITFQNIYEHAYIQVVLLHTHTHTHIYTYIPTHFAVACLCVEIYLFYVDCFGAVGTFCFMTWCMEHPDGCIQPTACIQHAYSV